MWLVYVYWKPIQNLTTLYKLIEQAEGTYLRDHYQFMARSRQRRYFEYIENWNFIERSFAKCSKVNVQYLSASHFQLGLFRQKLCLNCVLHAGGSMMVNNEQHLIHLNFSKRFGRNPVLGLKQYLRFRLRTVEINFCFWQIIGCWLLFISMKPKLLL